MAASVHPANAPTNDAAATTVDAAVLTPGNPTADAAASNTTSAENGW